MFNFLQNFLGSYRNNRTRPKNGSGAVRSQIIIILSGNNPANDHQYILSAKFSQFFNQLR